MGDPVTQNWSGLTNPRTGRPFASADEFSSYQTDMRAQNAAAGTAGTDASNNAYGRAFSDQHTTGYDFGTGTNTSIYTDPKSGYVYFGGSGSGLNGGANFTERLNDGSYIASGAAGYIDPNTGRIVYGDGSAPKDQQVADPSGNQGGAKLYDPNSGQGGTSKDYWYSQDYGLGPDALGIIPLLRDASGRPTKFYSGTPGGGGKVVDSLAEAQANVAAYKSWYDSQHPQGSAGSQIGPTAATGGVAPSTGADTPTTQTTPGNLTTPGTGEQYYDATKGLYGQPTASKTVYDTLAAGAGTPTNAQQTRDALVASGTTPTNAQTVFDQTPNQPTDSQQLWEQYQGIYQNPHYLDDYYGRQLAGAQTTLDRKSASAGWGDSGAAARATGNLGVVYGDAAIKGMEGFTTTGMGLAGASDSSRNALATLRGGLASGADTSNLGRGSQLISASGTADQANLGKSGQLITAGQGADQAGLAQVLGGQASANSAQTLGENRQTGGLDRATTLANDMATLTVAGFNPADAEDYSSQLTGLQLQVQQGKLTDDQAYKQAQELAGTMGIVAGSTLNALLVQKFMSK